MSDIPRRVFEWNELTEAIEFALDEGQSLHLHSFCGQRAPKCFRDAIARGEQIAHLFDQDEDRLLRTATFLGVSRLVVEHRGRDRQHIDLCGGPLKRAVRLFSLSQKSLFPELESSRA